MDTPPRTKPLPSKIPVLNKDYVSSDLSSSAQEEMPSFVHVAEVHSSRTQLLGTSDEGPERAGSKKPEKKRKKVRKRSTFTLKSAEDEIKVYNSDELDEPRGNLSMESDILVSSIKQPLPKPRGSSAKTVKERVEIFNMLSKESSIKSTSEPIFKEPGPVAWRKSRPMTHNSAERRGSATETLSESSSERSSKIKLGPLSATGRHRRPRGSATETLSEDSSTKSPEKSTPIKPPVPLPRKSLTQSMENILEAKKEDLVKNVTESPKSYCTSSSMDYKDTGVIPPPRHKRIKKKRKLKEENQLKTEDVSENESRSSLESINKIKSRTPTSLTPAKDDTAVCLTIHGCEPLKVRDFSSRPFLRVHVLDVKLASYKKSAFGKMNVDIVQTHPFDCRCQRSMIPRWDEDLLWMEPISHIASIESLIIFELLESDTEDIIAWAFLKPVAVNGATNVGKKLRLQFHKPSRSLPSAAKDSDLPKPYYWWSRGKYNNYKSTLFVTLNAVPADIIIRPQENVEDNVEKEEENSDSFTKEKNSSLKTIHVEDDLKNVIWSRLPTLSCKLPNKILSNLPSGSDGGMAVAYSNSGLLLACHTSQTITVFTFKGTRYLTLIGHHGLVYNLSWSSDDSFLLSSSADATACLWDITNKRTRPVKVFAHPSYVYGACWLGLEHTVATGCYDYQIRIWSSAPDTGSHPVQHLLHHKARVNTLVSLRQKEGQNGKNEVLISGDSEGVIIFWRTKSDRSLELSRELKIKELRGKIINGLKVHPAGKRLLVHTRDSMLRMVDIASGSIIQWFQGGINTKLQTNSSFCGCGSRVISCSEDGTMVIWDGHTGERIALYKKLYHTDCPAAISFHPADHMMAVISHSAQSFPSLVIATFNRDFSGDDVGLLWIDSTIAEIHKSHHSLSSSSQTGSRGSINDLPDEAEESSPRSRVKAKKKKKKEIGIFKALLMGNKKEKKGMTNDGFHDTEAIIPDEKPFYTTSQQVKREYQIRNEPNIEMDHRLSDIIKKMDKILIAVAPSKSQNSKK